MQVCMACGAPLSADAPIPDAPGTHCAIGLVRFDPVHKWRTIRTGPALSAA